MSNHLYANDTQIDLTLTSGTKLWSTIHMSGRGGCWIVHNLVQLQSKTEIMIFAPPEDAQTLTLI